jgi:hypothetical protein
VTAASAPFTSISGMTPIATGISATSFLDGSVTFGSTYDYAVTAVDKAGNEAQAVTSVATPPPPGFFTVTPCRILDTRNSTGPFGGPALAAGSTRSFALAGQCGIPVAAKAVSLNVTITGATGAGLLTLFRGDIALPNVSTISFSAGQTRANNAVIGLAQDGSGTMTVHTGIATGTVHLIVDVNGYFQ